MAIPSRLTRVYPVPQVNPLCIITSPFMNDFSYSTDPLSGRKTPDYDEVVKDTGGMASLANNRVLIPQDGYYRVLLEFSLEATGFPAGYLGLSYTAWVFRNSSRIASSEGKLIPNPNGGVGIEGHAETTAFFSAGQYVTSSSRIDDLGTPGTWRDEGAQLTVEYVQP